MNRYVVQVRSLVWPAPEYTTWTKGPYRSRILARLIAQGMRRNRIGHWREAEVVEVPPLHRPAGEGLLHVPSDESATRSWPDEGPQIQ